jgi:hypothetical protein
MTGSKERGRLKEQRKRAASYQSLLDRSLAAHPSRVTAVVWLSLPVRRKQQHHFDLARYPSTTDNKPNQKLSDSLSPLK